MSNGENQHYHREQSDVVVAANYARSYGHHIFETSSLGGVSVISEPGWDEYLKTLHKSVRELGPWALSPELITYQQVFSDIHKRKHQIKSRVKNILKLSRKACNTTFVLGTPVFDKSHRLPTNSQLSIKAGSVVARKDKGYIHPDTEESETFRTSMDARIPISPQKGMGMVVCSDLINFAYLQQIQRPHFKTRIPVADHDPGVNSETVAALMSACWSTPLKIGEFVAPSILPDEQRYTSQLETSVKALFERYPNLKDLVVADRVPDGSNIDGPLNCHYTRSVTS